eukprot:5857385-Alexandrium_andersonii.AAC.1
MDTPKNRAQYGALTQYISRNSGVTLCDGRKYWGELRQFCVTNKGGRSIDLWHHGDEGMKEPQRWDRLAYHFDKHIQTAAYLALASSVNRQAR